MLKTFGISFWLHITYKVNSILYSIRQIPLIKRLIPATVYQIKGFKVFGTVLSIIGELFGLFFRKLLYFLIMIATAVSLYDLPDELTGQAYLHILILLTMIGVLAKKDMFHATKDKYYAVILLGMDARKYAVVNFIYEKAKEFVGFLFCGVLYGFLFGLSIWQSLMIPFFVVGIKTAGNAEELCSYEKRGTVKRGKVREALDVVFAIVLFLAVYGLPFMRWMLPVSVSVAIMAAGIILGVLSFYKILTFRQYRPMLKEVLSDSELFVSAAEMQTELAREASLNGISTDVVESKKKGLEYLNELFIKRHKAILWKSSKLIAIVALAFFAVVVIVFQMIPEAKAAVNKMLVSALPIMLFLMYMMNRGTSFTQALFVNCDHSLLTYSFFKQPGSILHLFWIRLRELVKINLLPAAVIGFGLAFLLYVSGGTEKPLNYIIIIGSILCMSIFFSVHYLTVYYLLQPYNASTEIKSGMYQVINGIVYVVCYYMINLKAPTVIFGLAMIAFCVLYCAVASILIYLFAPKTFRIRN